MRFQMCRCNHPSPQSGFCIGAYKKVRIDMLEEAVSVSVGETDRKRRDSSERVIEPYAQVVHSSSADKRTVSRVCLLETVSV